MSNTCPKCGAEMTDKNEHIRVFGCDSHKFSEIPFHQSDRCRGRAEAIAEMAAWHPLSVPPMGVKTVIVRDETPEGYRYHLLTLRKGGSWQPTKQEWHTQPQWTDGVHVGEFYDVVMCLGTFRNPEWREVQP